MIQFSSCSNIAFDLNAAFGIRLWVGQGRPCYHREKDLMHRFFKFQLSENNRNKVYRNIERLDLEQSAYTD